MGPAQNHATEQNPNQLNLMEVATYQRRIRANIKRVWENVLDWEHLPWLHRSSFNYVELDEFGDWGWRTWSRPDHSTHVELCVDKTAGQYVARSYKATEQVSEIWTRLKPVRDETDIDVSFSIVNVAEDAKHKLGKTYLDLYSLLWDEDETMMMDRQHNLDPIEPGPDAIDLGQWSSLRQQLPLTVRLRDRSWLLRIHQDKLLIHADRCPHRLGPLNQTIIADNQIECPWHGYKFDVSSGLCIDPEHASCKLPVPPEVYEDPATHHIILNCSADGINR